ncbi:senecionine N-oxygenase-like isoform X2 [Sitodiplosis mosellana]|uniref:senecionine N-oxygenase-like isoform X2 n=1 Tax=Sitodiplosis mosellana TaxID=263140 RepID=UPI0024444327|nr:senecionine N-oxygenase-like isoform X2 [Sitodiplosis mosellana]
MVKLSIFRPIYYGKFLELFAICQVYSSTQNGTTILNIAIIGAGASGITSAKYALDQGYNVTVYEHTEQIGGIWWYTDETDKDQYGNNIHSPMYQGLRTNLPYQLMEFPDFPYPKETISYPSQPVVLNYLQSYAERFDIKNHIKFSHLIIRVLPIENGKWQVIVKDLPNDKFITLIYDVVFVCTGRFSSLRYPSIPNEFQGKSLHSHDYRTAETFRDESVLLIGSGASGLDMVNHLSKTAQRITFSQNKRQNETKEEHEKRQRSLPRNVLLQDNVKSLTPTGAEFIDGSHQNFSVVIFATGYNFSYPFLSVNTGINVNENCVTPLYKQIFNIEHPTMAFIGVPFTACTIRVYDIQILPPKSEMLKDMQTQLQNHYKKGYRKRLTHFLGPEQKEYFDQLAEMADIENIPEVMSDMHFIARTTMLREPAQYQRYSMKQRTCRHTRGFSISLALAIRELLKHHICSALDI